MYVCIAEHFKVELFDLIDYTTKGPLLKHYKSSEDEYASRIEEDKKRWLIDTVFKNSTLWRSADSFTARTDELLQQISCNDFNNPKLDILLQLSIKPDHPWNADLLHKILIDKTLTERDKLWSTQISCSYSMSENLTVKKLIDWPYSAERTSLSNTFQNLEPEMVRLYAITLIWVTTSSHRELRDKATKSAIVILSKYPEYLLELMSKFSEVDDLYVKERLYAIAYGVVLNMENKDLITKIAEKTYKQVFETEKPVPHILLRDYARSVLEFAYHQNLLSDEINPENFRPPYKSDWPIENPSNSEIEALDDMQYSSVHHSLMGFAGDFGIYTMSCVHSFSPTPLTKTHPETGVELKRKFIDILSKEQKNLYDKYLTQYNSLKEKHREQSSKEKNRFIETFDEKQKEHFRWLFEDRFMDDRPATFSRQWAKRWICKQVYEMGWKKELFKNFENIMCSSSRERKNPIERIGKKYQWIALHKLLAHLADNVHYIKEYDDKKQYEGPWQLLLRDIDPTCYLRKTKYDDQRDNIPKCWWQPHLTQFPENTIEKQEEWLKSKNNAPDFKKILQIKNPDDNNNLWTILFNFVVQQKDMSQIKTEETDFYKLELWFRINTIIILEKDKKVFLEKIKNQELCGLGDLIGGKTEFLKEYSNKNNDTIDEWHTELRTNNDVCKVKYFVPVSRYTWESEDRSMDNGISFYLPSQILIDKLSLCYPPRQYKYWKDKRNYPVFTDPSICLTGPSSALIKTDILNSYLMQENLCLIWLIGGEKRIYGKEYRTGQRHDFSGVYYNSGDKIKGDVWYLRKIKWKR